MDLGSLTTSSSRVDIAYTWNLKRGSFALLIPSDVFSVNAAPAALSRHLFSHLIHSPYELVIVISAILIPMFVERLVWYRGDFHS
jgi:hypothetical protein